MSEKQLLVVRNSAERFCVITTIILVVQKENVPLEGAVEQACCSGEVMRIQTVWTKTKV